MLMVHSFGSSAPPFTTHSTAFESTIKHELGTDVDLDEVSLDIGLCEPDMEEAFADFLEKRISEWQPDVVVPIGSPAGKFVAKFRKRLFPQTPVVYTGMDRRTLPADAFAKNATFVGEDFDLKGLVEDMLQLHPETNNVVVILGATLWSGTGRRNSSRLLRRSRDESSLRGSTTCRLTRCWIWCRSCRRTRLFCWGC